jgi:DNA-binding response OmpR family regulator
MNEKLLVADDEEDVLTLVRKSMVTAGFNVITAADGAEALHEARTRRPALVLLDLMLPGMSGLEVCKVLKSDPATSKIPVIMLTAKAEEIDRIVGLELGADDYVTKPFSPRELVLRVKAVLRRSEKSEAPRELTHGPIAIDQERHLVRVKTRQIDLTATEFRLLALLIERRERTQSRDKLLNEVWGYETAIDTRTVDTHIRRLRQKLGPAGDCIETVRGFGYRIAAES